MGARDEWNEKLDKTPNVVSGVSQIATVQMSLATV